MAILTIEKNDGTIVALPEPAEMTFGIQDVDASTAGRNQKGKMFRDRVATKRKISCKWNPQNRENMSMLLNAVTDEYFKLTFPDAKTGTFQTMTVYVGDRTAPAYYIDGESNWLWSDLSMNFIER